MAPNVKFVQIDPDGSGKKIAVAEVTNGADTIEMQAVVVADPENPNAIASVEKAGGVDGNEYGSVVHALLHQVAQVFKRPLDIIVRNLGTAADPTTGRLRALVDFNGAQAVTGTVTAVTTVGAVTSLNQIATFDAKLVQLYSQDRQTWANCVRSRVS